MPASARNYRHRATRANGDHGFVVEQVHQPGHVDSGQAVQHALRGELQRVVVDALPEGVVVLSGAQSNGWDRHSALDGWA